MFIYKITAGGKVYIGFDTKPTYKKSRWKDHCRESLKDNPKRKIHIIMKEVGIENCQYEVIDDSFSSLGSLALSEIEYIEKYNSFKNGLNSSLGGDGLGHTGFSKLTEDEIQKIREKLGSKLKDYNTNIKWANTTKEDRKKLTAHLHTQEIYEKRSNTLKEFYKENPEEKSKKSKGITNWQKHNRDTLLNNNKKNSIKGAEKVSKKIKVELEDGTLLYYKSKSDFQRQTGQWANTIIQKTKLGNFFNGYKAWEI